MTEDYRELIQERALDQTNFSQMTFKGHLRRQEVPWREVRVRPVQIKSGLHLQFSYLTQRQDITSNYSYEESRRKLQELLELPFSSIYLRSREGDLQVQVKKNGKALVRHHRPADRSTEVPRGHDRVKPAAIPVGARDPLLRDLGITDADGRVRPRMHAKHTQINEFLKLLERTADLETISHRPVRIVDCGCGSAYLSFAAYHYLNDILGIEAELTGIDVNGELIEKCNRLAERLGYDRISFHVSSISEFEPEQRPDIVLALHACDTATDEAIAQAIRWGAEVVMCAPCCHHDLNKQLRSDVYPWEPALRHGILRERMGDILTDTFRSLVLRMMGYRSDVVVFISPEHTDKNLMIRAVKRSDPGDPQLVREYQDLKAYWQVTPYLEKLLSTELARYLP